MSRSGWSRPLPPPPLTFVRAVASQVPDLVAGVAFSDRRLIRRGQFVTAFIGQRLVTRLFALEVGKCALHIQQPLTEGLVVLCWDHVLPWSIWSGYRGGGVPSSKWGNPVFILQACLQGRSLRRYERRESWHVIEWNLRRHKVLSTSRQVQRGRCRTCVRRSSWCSTSGPVSWPAGWPAGKIQCLHLAVDTIFVTSQAEDASLNYK